MEIRFCTICNESIPDTDFEASRAFVAGGKSQHVACAMTQATERKGTRSWLPLLLGLYAAGVATYLLVGHLQAKNAPKEDVPKVSEAVESRIQTVTKQYVDASERRSMELGKERLGALETSLTEDFEARLSGEWKDRLGKEFKAGEKRVQDLQIAVDKRTGALETRSTALETEMARLDGWIRQLQEQARQLAMAGASRKSDDDGKGDDPQPTPENGGSDSPKLTPAQAAAEANALRKAVSLHIDLLEDTDEDLAYTGTTELARIPVLRGGGQDYLDLLKEWKLNLSAPPNATLVAQLEREAGAALLKTLKATKKGKWLRLGSAVALGELRHADAVPTLIDVLQDKKESLRAASGEALHKITGQSFDFDAAMQKQERRNVQRKYEAWWKANEESVRTRLQQPK